MTLKPGDRIRIHPASDWFMRGERYATVIHEGYATPTQVARVPPHVRVRGDRSGRMFRLGLADVIEVVE